MGAENTKGKSLDWEDEVESDGAEFILLDEGDYTFTVSNFERGRFPGSEKMEPSNKAIITLEVQTDAGTTSFKTDIILNQKMEWKISEFFRSIGMKKRGERIKYNWNKVKGAKGRAHIIQKSYKEANGNERKRNEVRRFLDYDPKYFNEDSFSDATQEEIPF